MATKKNDALIVDVKKSFSTRVLKEERYAPLNKKIIEKIEDINAAQKQPERLYDSNIFKIPDDEFGVISHIDYTEVAYQRALKDIELLKQEFNKDNKSSLIARVKAYLDKLKDHDVYKAYKLDQLDENKFLIEHKSPSEVIKGWAVFDGRVAIKTEKPLAGNFRHPLLFSLGKVTKNDIALVELLRRQLVVLHKVQQKILAEKYAALKKVESEIPLRHQSLANLNNQRLRSEADYQVARLLVAENWADIERAYAERARILNNHKGLFYARVRETPINLRPVNPLPLRHGTPDDLVPGYPLEDAELPEDINIFVETVLEIPMRDWVALHDQYLFLPARATLQHMLGERQIRLIYRADKKFQASETMTSLKLQRLRNQSIVLMSDMLRRGFVAPISMIEYQYNVSQLLSLEDLLNGPPHRLRGTAETLRNKLDQAIHSLLKELRKITPSLRVQWAEAAEQDTLDIKSPTQWPGIGKAEVKDLNGIRTLVELIQWWWRQLTPAASGTSHAIVRNLIRAILLVSVSDDPDQILHGHLISPPSRFSVGGVLRVALNKEALAGTLLRMVDPDNILIGTLRVDDFDDKGALTTLTQLLVKDAVPSTAFTVTGFALPGKTR